MEKENPSGAGGGQRRANAGTAAVMRGVVAAYAAYMGYRLLRSAVTGEESDMPMGLRWGFGAAMLLLALAFGFYLWRRWRADTAADLPATGDGGNTAEEGGPHGGE